MEDKKHEKQDGSKLKQTLFSFGVIADVQYADRTDGVSGWRTMRYYSQSCLHLQSAIRHWNKEEVLPAFILQLGDIIDGCNRRFLTSEKSLQVVLKETENMKAPFHHIWGNHELDNFDLKYLWKSKLNSKHLEDKQTDDSHVCTAEKNDFYAYHFSPFTNFRFIIVDTYDLSVFGNDPSSPKQQKSQSFLSTTDFHEPHHLTFNGGFSREQLSWLHHVLSYSDKHNERVVIAGHVPIHPKAKHTPCLVWNYRDVLEVIQSHTCVVCYVAGHDHGGGYYQDSYGIHHITMEGVIECSPDTNAFATVYVYEDMMHLQGSGKVKSRILHYRK
ncbi:manganese-dependent ADP-ribose/CDP-alcohol diphosphatase isoform X2 [Bombina bombina]|nr:manganese-dependent ADP-ribose/CDP-alcohol diphosphatase isoform X2 [Bombina bombina]